MLKSPAKLVVVFCLAFLAASPAQGGGSKVAGCGVSEWSYAGLQSDRKAHGVAVTLVPIKAPLVSDGHVGGWVGIGGTNAGPNGGDEWIQVGLSAFSGLHNRRSSMYYEVAVPGAVPRYVELDPNIKPGEKHRVSVLEMSHRNSWWRVWVDRKPVSPPIYLPGSHAAWYPQAVAENWNGGTGTCNAYSYRFTNVTLALESGGKWRPLEGSSVYEDAGYKVLQTSASPRSFIATSL